MTTSPTAESVAADRAPRVGLWRLGIGMFLASVAVFAPALAMAISLMPARLAELAPDDKVMWVGILGSTTTVLSFITGLTFGAISDRTRTRLGARNPWVLVGGFITAAATAGEAFATTLAPFLFLSYVQAFGVALTVATLMPIIPDRVRQERRGAISTAVGLGPLIGASVGIGIASLFPADQDLAFLVLGAVSALLILMFQLLAPDHSNVDVARMPAVNPFRAIAFPRNAPGFYWAFFGRLGVILGYYTVGGFQLYVLTDYMNVDATEAVQLLGVAAVINLVTSVVGAAISGPLSDWLGRRKVLVIASGVIIGLGVAALLFVPTVTGFLIYFGIAGFGLGIFLAVDQALLSDLLPQQQNFGKDLGLLNLATNGGQFFGPITGSVIVGAGLGFPVVFIVALACCFTGAALIIPIRNVR